MSNFRIGISLIDENDDELILSKRILNIIWSPIAVDKNDLREPSKLFLDEISNILSEKIHQNLKESIRSMIEELMKNPVVREVKN